MFLIKFAQTNLDITDNYFQFEKGKNKPLQKTYKKIWRGLLTEPDESDMFLNLESVKSGSLKC